MSEEIPPATQCHPQGELITERKAHLLDLVFVISPKNRGWILEAVCQEVAKYFPGTFTMHYDVTGFPPGKAYFFSHWSLFLAARRDPNIAGATTLIFFTHPPAYGRVRMRRLSRSLNRSTQVVSMSSLHAAGLVAHGLHRARVEVVVPGADPGLFPPHSRSDGAVGLCSAYYPRKSPDHVFDIVRTMPHRNFLLVGRRWEQAPRYRELVRLPNFTYVEAPYEDYPRHYRQMDVFLSPSKLEGGPIPLLEAMMSNVVPVATRTGFSPDLIEDGRNGYLYESNDDLQVTCDLIERAFALDSNVRDTVVHLTWERYSREVQSLL